MRRCPNALSRSFANRIKFFNLFSMAALYSTFFSKIRVLQKAGYNIVAIYWKFRKGSLLYLSTFEGFSLDPYALPYLKIC